MVLAICESEKPVRDRTDRNQLHVCTTYPTIVLSTGCIFLLIYEIQSDVQYKSTHTHQNSHSPELEEETIKAP